jgi:hypothetical protein
MKKIDKINKGIGSGNSTGSGSGTGRGWGKGRATGRGKGDGSNKTLVKIEHQKRITQYVVSGIDS